MRPHYSHGSTFKQTLLLLLSVFISAPGMAQEDGVFIEGELRHKKTREPLDNVTVTVMAGDEVFDQFEASARYSFEVPFDADYVLMFGVVDMVPQSVQVNASEVPEDVRGGLDQLTWPVMLFDYVEGFDMSVVEEPLGIFRYDDARESLEFDRSHSSRMKGLLDDEMDRLGNQGRDQARNQIRYEYAMEDAQKAEKKGRWAVAKEEYEQALSYKPNDPQATEGLERANRALNPEPTTSDREDEQETDPAPEEESISEAPPTQEPTEEPAQNTERAAQNEAPKAQTEVKKERSEDTSTRAREPRGGASVLSAPSVPIATVSRQELSDAEDAEEYYRQALIAERQARITQVQNEQRRARDVQDDIRINAEDAAASAWTDAVEFHRDFERIEEELRIESARLGRAFDLQKFELVQSEVERQRAVDEELRTESLNVELVKEAKRVRPERAFLSAEDRDIPHGVTQTVDEIQNGKVITRIVRVGDVVNRYRKVIMKTGTFYYRGDRSITKTEWELETNLTR